MSIMVPDYLLQLWYRVPQANLRMVCGIIQAPALLSQARTQVRFSICYDAESPVAWVILMVSVVG